MEQILPLWCHPGDRKGRKAKNPKEDRKMKNTVRKVVAGVLMFFAVMFFAASGFGAEQKEDLSPYFFVKGSSGVESFPLLKTDVKVDIAGISSEVELTQTYKNDGKKTIEALYCFPLGTRSAIHAMRMKIGKRIIEAEIHQNEEARQIYEAAKNNGQTASLLEQKRPNVFQMNVANIMPGDIVEVTVNYTEILVPEAGVYEFIYPTVVGPRYTGESSTADLKGKDNWTVAPYTHQGDAPSYDLGMTVNMNPGMDVASISSPSHRINTEWENGKARVTLADGEKKSGNRDFVLRYSLKGKQIQTGVLLYPGDKENFFVMMMQPPQRPAPEAIPPREYFFILDVSGSMYGYPLEISKQVIKKILASMSSRDYFNVMFFSGGADTLFKHSMPATGNNISKAMQMVNAAQGSGGTEIINALQTAFAKEKKEGMSRSFVIMTDGYVSVEKDVFDLMRAKMGEANFFPFGIGTSVNRYLMEGMARIGKGEPFVALNQEEGEKMADKFVNYVKSPVLTDIKVKFDGFDAYDVEPESVPDLFAERPLVVMGKYHKADGRIVVTGRSGNGDFKREMRVASQLDDSRNIALKYMWARERIARLADYSKVGVNVKADVTALGLEYGLMTEYTSFVAVDKEVRPTGEVVTVKQPLPLPEGVSDLAVGDVQTKTLYRAAANSPAATGGVMEEAEAVEMAAPAPVCKKEKAVSGYGWNKHAAEDKDDTSTGSVQGISTIYLSDAKLPDNVDTNAVEKAILGAVKAELEAYFAKNGLTGLKLELKVENGNIKAVKVLSYKGTAAPQDALDKIMAKVKIGSVSGTLEVTLETN
jgi:Ca-activated chloride channel family protein